MQGFTLEQVGKNLFERGFIPHIAKDKAEAKLLAMEIIGHDSVGFGGSMTTEEIGLYDALKEMGNEVYFHWKSDDPAKARIAAAHADCYVSSANALSANGIIINIDGNGNRVAGTFQGPKKVIFLIGRNKITKDVESGMKRAKEVASPPNAKRLNKKTPCAVTGKCMDCKSPDRICKVTVLMEGPSMHVDHVHVILVDEDLGY